jgi:putative molybdopterin biosynthesis protein
VGRSADGAVVENRVRDLRTRAGLSQAGLARQTGLTRQAVSAIESDQYVPNTAVALRLASVLRCAVEDLFALADAAAPPIDVLDDGPTDSRRLALARVSDRWIGYPLTEAHQVQQGFVGADAVRGETETGPAVQLLRPVERLEQTAVVLGCDPALSILSAGLSSRAGEDRLLWLSAASQAALDALTRGEAHIAGTHLHDPDGGTYNLLQARRALGRTGGVVVEFARWEQGLIVAAGNPKGIGRVEDLARPNVRLVNREPGSGSRALLDGLLEAVRIPREAIAGYDREASGHMAAAWAVASGGADAAISLRGAASVLGLGFVPLDEVRFDLVIPRPHLEHSAVAQLLDLMQSGGLRSEVGSLPGYDASGMGTVHLDLQPDGGDGPPRKRRAS